MVKAVVEPWRGYKAAADDIRAYQCLVKVTFTVFKEHKK